MSIRLPVQEHSRACVCVCVSVRACVCACMCVSMHACMHACTYVCIGPMCGSFILAVGPGPPFPDKNPGSAHGSARLSIHLSIDQLGRLACLDEVSIDAHL